MDNLKKIGFWIDVYHLVYDKDYSQEDRQSDFIEDQIYIKGEIRKLVERERKLNTVR